MGDVTGHQNCSDATSCKEARTAPWSGLHVAVRLDEDNGRSLYVPERFAHGYQTLVDATETSYFVGEFYTPDA